MIELRSVVKRYGTFAAVENLSIEIASHELCVLVGPSGCGKTTTLKMINRLIEPTSGSILIDGVDVLSLNPVELRRGIGYVMQQGGLFPHRRVADNVATIPRLLGWPAPRVAERVDELLELVGLDPTTYRRRFPHELSGGERQRVGVARALGADPLILLMDEPFGAVDPIARRRLQVEFLELQARLGKTVVFVTHDIDEALLLGHRIAMMQRGGVIEQLDTPAAVLSRPATPFVAEFVGADRDIRRLGVTDIIERDLIGAPTVAPGATVSEMAALVRGTGVQRLVVVDAGSPLGFVDDPGTGGSAADKMRPFAAVIPLGDSLRSVLVAMFDDDDPVVAVTGEGGYLGIVTLESLHAIVRRSAKRTRVGKMSLSRALHRRREPRAGSPELA